MKPKVALVNDGFLPKGSENTRGRLSKAAIARCEELAAQGVQIEGFTVNKPTDSDQAPKVSREKVTNEKVVVEPIAQARATDSFVPFVSYNGKHVKWAMGQFGVCDNCGNSLTYCHCTDPRVMHEGRSMPVFFEAVK